MDDHAAILSNLLPILVAFVLPVVGTIATFAFLIIVVKARSSVREKEAFYKNEAIQRIAASPDGATAVVEYLREEKLQAEKHRREKLLLGGMITTAVGLGLMIYLFARHYSDHDAYEHLIGIIPFLIGVAMLAYTYWLAPKE